MVFVFFVFFGVVSYAYKGKETQCIPVEISLIISCVSDFAVKRRKCYWREVYNLFRCGIDRFSPIANNDNLGN